MDISCMTRDKTRGRQFPVLAGLGTVGGSVPWDMLAPREDRVFKNHGQTLEQLAERGGLGWEEIVWILLGRQWGSPPKLDTVTAERFVLGYIACWEKEGETTGASSRTCGGR